MKATEVDFESAVRYFDKHLDKMKNYVNLCLSTPKVISTVIDVGANAGVFSSLLLEASANINRLVAMEPIPNLAGICGENLRRFSDNARIDVLTLAASDTNQPTKIKVWENNYGASTMVTEAAPGSFQTITINTEKVDEIVKQYSLEPDLIKIDVEGFEYAVLSGMHSTLATYRPIVFLEIGWGGKNHPRWKQELEALDFVTEKLDYTFCDLKFKKYDYRLINATSDWFLIPNEFVRR